MPAYTGFKAEHLGRYGDPSQTAQSAHFLAQMEMGGDRKFNSGYMRKTGTKLLAYGFQMAQNELSISQQAFAL